MEYAVLLYFRYLWKHFQNNEIISENISFALQVRNGRYMSITIKNIEIGSGIPVICVPIVERRKFEIVDRVKYAIAQGVRMIEWRADYFNQLTDPDAVAEVLRELQPLMKDTILLFTVRSIVEGGVAKLSEEAYQDVYRYAAEQGIVDIMDLEYYQLTDPKGFMEELHQYNVTILNSHHDFMKTPDASFMFDTLQKMHYDGADIVKVAVTPEETLDLVNILSVTAHFHDKYPDVPVITISMGRLGILSRISGEVFGSAITFGALGEQSAPGQIDAIRLQSILDDIHDLHTGGRG